MLGSGGIYVGLEEGRSEGVGHPIFLYSVNTQIIMSVEYFTDHF
jgi:hypothetical protein